MKNTIPLLSSRLFRPSLTVLLLVCLVCVSIVTPINQVSAADPAATSNYDIQVQASALADQVSNLRALLARPDVVLTLTPDQKTALQSSVADLNTAINGLLTGSLRDLITMEIRFDVRPTTTPRTNGIAVARLIDDRNATRTLDFILPYTLATTSPDETAILVGEVASRTAETLSMSYDALVRGATVVTSFTPGFDHYFYTATSTSIATTSEVAETLGTPETENGRSNIYKILVAGNVPTERFRIVVTYGNELDISGALLATTTETFSYNLTLKDVEYSDYILERAQDYRTQLIDEAARLTGLTSNAVQDKLSTSFRLFRNGADAQNKLDLDRSAEFRISTSSILAGIDNSRLTRVINTFGVLGDFSQLTSVSIKPGRNELQISTRSDQNEVLSFSMSEDWDYDEDDGYELEGYNVNTTYTIYGEELMELTDYIDVGDIVDSMNRSFNEIAAGRGDAFGITDAQLAADMRRFLVQNSLIYSDVDGIPPPGAQCFTSDEITKTQYLVDHFTTGMNLADTVENITSVLTRGGIYRDSDDDLVSGCQLRDPAGYYRHIAL